MKNFFLLIITFIQVYVFGQTYKIQYNYEVRDFMANEKFSFIPILYYDINSNSKLYEVKFGISAENTSVIDKNVVGTPMLKSKDSNVYLLYSFLNKALIKDKIDGKEYVFEDEVPLMAWSYSSETKVKNDVVLSKANTVFRGNTYDVWYDKNFPHDIAPWKFNNLKGLVYEVTELGNQFVWSLKKIEQVDLPVVNPFSDQKYGIISFRKYPEINFAIPEKVREFIKNNPHLNVNMKEERYGLEIKFEWE